MKIICIGDIHGRSYWKEIDPSKYDLIVFVGDYVDQFPPMTDVEIESNLLAIIELKKAFPEKVILLLGNHDIQYFFLNEGFGCTGFRPSMASNLNMIFKHNKNLFQIAYQYKNYLWTHAGVSTSWYDWNKVEIEEFKEKSGATDYADLFNKMLWAKENRLLHQVSRSRGGAYSFGGITWADKNETSTDYLPGIHQIVGHSPVRVIDKYGDENGSIRYIDVLNEVYFAIKEHEEAEKKWGRNTEYDAKIRELFPDIKHEKKPLILPTKFYEFEIHEQS